MLARLMELQQSNEYLTEIAKGFGADDIPNTDFSGLSLVQVFFRFEAARISGIDDLDELLDALELLMMISGGALSRYWRMTPLGLLPF